MVFPIVSVAPKSMRRAAALIATTASLVLAAGPVALAQTAPKAAPKAQQKAPAAQPAQPAAPAQAAQPPQPELPPIVYSPWTKFCGKDQQQANAKEVCLTVKEARLESGQFLAGAAVIEQNGEAKKLLRITLPLGMQLPQGTRLILDQEQPLQGRYVVCLPNGCMADFEIDAAFIGKLKKGKQIVLQGINLPGQFATYPLPLADFGKANDGPPTDPKVFEEQQKKLQEELQRRAEEARKRLQGGAGAPAGAPKQ